MPRQQDESRPEFVQRILARSLPALLEEVEATVYYLNNLPQSLRREASPRAIALTQCAEAIRILMGEAGKKEKRVVRPVPAYSEYEYPERTASVFEQDHEGET